MGSSLYQRLEGKSAEDALVERIAETFNLAPIFARTDFEEMRRLFAEHLRLPDKAGTLLLHALAVDEPAGKPLRECRKVLVELSPEALDQGALLTQEDLARLLCSSISTIKRDAEALRRDGFTVPNRGAIQDIGPGVSHKAMIVRLYLESFSFAELERRSRHSKRAIERYLKHFVQVARLQHAGHPPEEIRLITGLSARVIEQYLQLLKTHERSWRLKEPSILPSAPRLVMTAPEAGKGGPHEPRPRTRARARPRLQRAQAPGRTALPGDQDPPGPARHQVPLRVWLPEWPPRGRTHRR